MSPQIQIILAFATVLVVLIVLAVFLKKSRILWAVSAACIVPIAIFTVILSAFVFNDPANAILSAKEAELAKVKSSDYIDISDLLLTRGLTRTAEKTLDEYASRYPVSTGYLQSRAYLDAIRGNYGSAKGILSSLIKTDKIDQDDVSDEISVLEDAIAGKSTHSNVVKTILSAIKRRKYSDSVTRMVEAYAIIDRMDAARASSGAAENAAKKYKSILEDNPSQAFPASFETSYLKALMISGDYCTIIGRSENYNDSHELLIMGELLREKKFTKEDISNATRSDKNRERNRRVVEWIKTQKSERDYGDSTVTLDRAVKVLSETHTDSLETYTEWLQNRIRTFAEMPGERESSKLYMELAYIAYSEGDDTESAVNIRKALVSGADSEDIAYVAPVNRVNEILENREDTESLKEIDEYVHMMVGNMQTEEMKPDAGVDFNVDLSDFADAVTEDLVEETHEDADNGSDESNHNITAPEDTEFGDFAGAQVSQITVAINIASIDHSKFEEVSAVIAMDESIASNVDEFKKNIALYDCDISIDQYTVEKLPDVGVNVILVCDNSGSMSGDKIANLKTAIQAFVDNKDPDVKVGIVSFDSGVLEEGSTPLGSSDAQLNQAVEEMGAKGGTYIYSGVEEAISQMQPSDAINVIIVMSDGNDSGINDATANEITKSCMDREIMIYTMGLGSDVDSGNLSRFSDAGGGSYTFVSDSNTLLSFYNYIYSISRNRFRVSYTAEDTIQVNRKLLAEYRDNVQVNDVRKYSLIDNSDLDGNDTGENYSIALEGVTLGGLDTRLLYKSSQDQEVHLLGKDLKKELEIKVSIKSGTTYDLACEYETDSSWKVIIPATASCGDYDVIVTVNGKRGVFKSGLIITNNKLNIIRFGQYVFEATSVGKTDKGITLSGYVQMNGWLGFTGTVTITGDPGSDESIVLNAPMTYVKYSKGEKNLNGLAAFMSEHGSVINLLHLNDLSLFRNDSIPPSSDTFRTEPMTVPAITVQNLFELNAPGLSLYPDRMEIDFNKFTTKFPFQDKLLKAGELDQIFDFSVDHKETLIISQFAVDCDIDFSVGAVDKKSYDEIPLSNSKKVNAYFGNFRLLANLDEFNLKINTRDNNYSFKILVNVAMLADGIGFELNWSDGQFDAVKLHADFDIPANIGGVPVTFSKFSLGVSGISGVASSGWDLTGGCKISFAKVSQFLPGIQKYIGDISVCSLDDVELKIHFGEPNISLSAKFMLLDAVELGHAKIQLGAGLSYSNTLLGYDGESVSGAVGEVGTGIKVDTSNLKLDIGATIELALTNRVMGLTAEGHLKYDVHWWILGKSDSFEGRMFLGCYQKQNQKYAFALLFQKGGNEVIRFDWDVDKVIA